LTFILAKKKKKYHQAMEVKMLMRLSLQLIMSRNGTGIFFFFRKE